jgi:hypothetical protein
LNSLLHILKYRDADGRNQVTLGARLEYFLP